MKSNTFSKTTVPGRPGALRSRRSRPRVAGWGTAGLSRRPQRSVRVGEGQRAPSAVSRQTSDPRPADGAGAQGTGAAHTTQRSPGGHAACSGGPPGPLPAPKPWDAKTSPQMTSSDHICLPLLDQACVAVAT